MYERNIKFRGYKFSQVWMSWNLVKKNLKFNQNEYM